jgi:hypothetical protein
MSDVLQTVLENPAARSTEAITVAASQAAAEFAPWGAVVE